MTFARAHRSHVLITVAQRTDFGRAVSMSMPYLVAIPADELISTALPNINMRCVSVALNLLVPKVMASPTGGRLCALFVAMIRAKAVGAVLVFVDQLLHCCRIVRAVVRCRQLVCRPDFERKVVAIGVVML